MSMGRKKSMKIKRVVCWFSQKRASAWAHVHLRPDVCMYVPNMVYNTKFVTRSNQARHQMCFSSHMNRPVLRTRDWFPCFACCHYRIHYLIIVCQRASSWALTRTLFFALICCAPSCVVIFRRDVGVARRNDSPLAWLRTLSIVSPSRCAMTRVCVIFASWHWHSNETGNNHIWEQNSGQPTAEGGRIQQNGFIRSFASEKEPEKEGQAKLRHNSQSQSRSLNFKSM